MLDREKEGAELREKVMYGFPTKEERLLFYLFYAEPGEHYISIENITPEYMEQLEKESEGYKMSDEFIQRVKPLLEEELRKRRGKQQKSGV